MQTPLIEPVGEPIELRDLAVLLVKHYGLHEGLYDLSFEINMGAGRFMMEPGMTLPGAVFGIRNAGLVRVAVAGLDTVDAAEVNPAPKSKSVRKAQTAPAR